jgi:dihydroorotate dehydrogenase (NAD+) catalytic subunit
LPPDAEVVFVGAGCGIAPILRAAQSHPGPRRFALGTRSVKATAFLERLHGLGPVVHATEDGSSGLSGVALDALNTLLERYPPRGDVVFYNCGPEIVLSQVDAVERGVAPPSRIFHVVERITSCGIGICGKCATPEGLRVCVDGPVFSGEQFSPLRYSRDKTGRVVELGGGPKACPPS